MLLTKPRLKLSENPVFWLAMMIGCAVAVIASKDSLMFPVWIVITALASANFGAADKHHIIGTPMTGREIDAGADALFNIAMAHGYRLNDVEAREGARAVLRAAETARGGPPGSPANGEGAADSKEG